MNVLHYGIVKTVVALLVFDFIRKTLKRFFSGIIIIWQTIPTNFLKKKISPFY